MHSGDVSSLLSHMREFCQKHAEEATNEYTETWWLDSMRFYADAYNEFVDYQSCNPSGFVRQLNHLNRMHIDEAPGYLASLKNVLHTLDDPRYY